MKSTTSIALRFVALACLVVGTPAAGAQNLITNPSFDSDATGWSPGSDYVELVYRPDVGSTLSNGSGPGSAEIRLSFWNGTSSGIRQEITVVQGVEYDLGFSAFAPSADNPANGIVLVAYWYDLDGIQVDWNYVQAYPFDYDTWIRVEGTMTAPAGAVTLRLLASVQNPSDDQETRPGVLWVDDVWVAEVGASTTVQEAFFPAGASVAGLQGTFWTTDGWFRNTSGAGVELTGAFLPPNTDNSATVASPVSLGTVPANGSVVLEDIVSELGGDDKTGGVYLRAEAIGGTQLPFFFGTSYTSTPNPGAGGSYGQGIPLVGQGEKGIAIAPGAFQNAERRTNAGALNTSPHTISVRVVVVDADGATAGSQTWNLQPYEQRQVSLPKLGVSRLDGGSVVFDLMSTVGSFRAYISTVDDVTGDAVYTAAQ